MQQDPNPLEEEAFDLAATRPLLYNTDDFVNDLIFDAVWVGGIAMFWSAAKIMLRNDYHGWDIFVAWLRLDFRCLNTREWGGAHIASFPLHSPYRCGGFSDVD